MKRNYLFATNSDFLISLQQNEKQLQKLHKRGSQGPKKRSGKGEGEGGKGGGGDEAQTEYLQ